jgi:hypothetical protein
MAKSVVVNERQVPGAAYVTRVTITLDGAGNGGPGYPALGYPIAAADFNYSILDHVEVQDGTGSGYLFRWDPLQGTIRGFQQNGSTGPFQEIPNATDLSAVTLVAWGKGR